MNRLRLPFLNLSLRQNSLKYELYISSTFSISFCSRAAIDSITLQYSLYCNSRSFSSFVFSAVVLGKEVSSPFVFPLLQSKPEGTKVSIRSVPFFETGIIGSTSSITIGGFLPQY